MESPKDKPIDVITLGNTLMDFLVEVDDTHLAAMNLRKGEGKLVDEQEASLLLQNINGKNVEMVPGGSSANVARALGMLGSAVILCGRVGNDEHGNIYREAMQNHNVITRLNGHACRTGHALTYITPDSERTFSVHLGAAIELCPEDILEEDIANSKVLHLEGYQLEGKTRETVLHAVHLAKKYGTIISLDLSDGGVIRRNKEYLLEFVKNYVDIIFANELEAEDFTGKTEAEAAEEMGMATKIAIVKIGERGSYICRNNEIVHVPSFKAAAIDTTGAGDTYAAGFLYGYCRGWSVEKAGELGSRLAARIIEKKGVRFDAQEMETIKAMF